MCSGPSLCELRWGWGRGVAGGGIPGSLARLSAKAAACALSRLPGAVRLGELFPAGDSPGKAALGCFGLTCHLGLEPVGPEQCPARGQPCALGLCSEPVSGCPSSLSARALAQMDGDGAAVWRALCPVDLRPSELGRPSLPLWGLDASLPASIPAPLGSRVFSACRGGAR